MSKTRKIFILIFIILNLSKVSLGQNYDIEEANDLLLSKSYNEAIIAFKQLLTTENSANLHYKLGLCYYHLDKKEQSIPSFENAIKDIYGKYSLKNIALQYAPIDAYYYLGRAHHVNGNLILAFDFYNKFYENAKKRHSLKYKSYLGILQCEVANELIKNKTTDMVWAVGDTLNTTLEESNPVISLDGTTIYFASSRLRTDLSNKNSIDPNTGNYYKDTYVSNRTENGTWTKPTLLPLSQLDINESPASLSPNGHQLLINHKALKGSNIAKSDIKNSTFTELEAFPAKQLNTRNNDIDASLNFNEEYLYFSSNRRGGYGGYDLYRIRRLPDGSWSRATNLGEEINSKNDEVSPYIGLDNKTLHFSSNGEKSMGGFDIFVSKVNTIGEWSKPKNLGVPINSTNDELSYSTIANGSKGIYSTNRDEKTNHDLYFAQSSNSYYQNVAILKGKIKTKNNSLLPKGITIVVQDLTENTKPQTFKPRIKDGGYILNLKPCHNYIINYVYDEKSFFKAEKLVPCNSSYQEIHQEVILDVINMP